MTARIETVFRRVALGCAFLMLLGPFGDRTAYVKGRGTASIIDAAGYNIVAVVTGMVALAAIALAGWSRARAGLTVFGVAGAVAAFGLSVWFSGVAVWARFQGEVWFYGTSSYATDAADMGRRMTLNPAEGPFVFTAVALIGALASVAFGFMRLWRLKAEKPDAGSQGSLAPSDDFVRWVAFGCAVFLLLGPLGGRTMLVDRNITITDSAVYNMVAVISGIVALTGLAVADRARQGALLIVLGAIGAIAAFGFTAFFAGMFSIPLFRGEVMLDGGWVIRDTIEVHPAYGPPFFALAALIGAISTLALAIARLHQPKAV